MVYDEFFFIFAIVDIDGVSIGGLVDGVLNCTIITWSRSTDVVGVSVGDLLVVLGGFFGVCCEELFDFFWIWFAYMYVFEECLEL